MRMKIALIASVLALMSMLVFAKNYPSKTMACPSQDFKVFLDAFAANKELQKAFTQIPGVSNDTIIFPMIPDAAARKSDAMNLKVVALKKNKAKVVLDKDETDYKIVFYFEKKKCWMLVKAEDLSG